MASKKDLAKLVAEKTNFPLKKSEFAVNAVFSALTEFLAEDEKVQITGFGTFEVRERAAHKGRNPRTGEAVEIPAKKTPAFKAGKLLKNAVK